MNTTAPVYHHKVARGGGGGGPAGHGLGDGAISSLQVGCLRKVRVHACGAVRQAGGQLRGGTPCSTAAPCAGGVGARRAKAASAAQTAAGSAVEVARCLCQHELVQAPVVVHLAPYLPPGQLLQ